jgi:hypothetical protein
VIQARPISAGKDMATAHSHRGTYNCTSVRGSDHSGGGGRPPLGSSGWGGVPRGRRHVLVPPSRATQVRPSPREEYRDVPSRRVGRHGTELAGILSRARGPRRSARQPVSHHPQQRPCRLRAGSVTSRCFPGHLSGQRTLKVSLTNDSPARLTRRPPLVSVA